MMIYRKEMRQSFKSLVIWTCSIAFMLLICIFMFPEMKGEMDSVSSVFSNMGEFSAAFGMDQLSFGELMGFYGVECGNILGIGGGFFAALAGISVLAGEEKERTAEFLLTYPVSRTSVLTQKLAAVLTQVIVLNIFAEAVSLISAAVIGESFQMREFLLLHTAYMMMQIEIACICFGISAFIRRGSIGIGLGLALVLYFMNIICNISEQAEFLKYITPYAYAEASNIISGSELEWGLIGFGAVYALVGIVVAFLKYTKKDIAS
ncbi:ABC transporter permease subunit [uncultured Ruminococcus sp.]|uniref:ABC transporter permease subunit n=2 Tax=uncultured Ruminococcus sp. TaxID=165186 RepID=UPI00260E1F60|nr:ABC transporter permease subunit [uncultured Ruminococcus sp.]